MVVSEASRFRMHLSQDHPKIWIEAPNIKIFIANNSLKVRPFCTKN